MQQQRDHHALAPPPPDGPPPPEQADFILNGQYASLSVVFTGLVQMLRDPSSALSGADDTLNSEIMCPRALTYELFGAMVRSVVDKLQANELGSRNGARVLQTMLWSLRHDLGRCAVPSEACFHEQQAMVLIERAVCEACTTLDAVMKNVDAGTGKRQRLDSGVHGEADGLVVQGEVQGAVVAALPVLLRLVIWLARSTLNGAAKEGDDTQAPEPETGPKPDLTRT
jgi:hypothetical protein